MKFNPGDFFKQANVIQQKIKDMQENMKNIQVTGTSGGDMVKIVMNGQFQVKELKIAPEIYDSGDIEMVQDLIVAALNDCLNKVKEITQNEMTKATGGINIMGLFNQ